MTSINNVVTRYTQRTLWATGVTPARVALLMGPVATPDLAGNNWPISGDALASAIPDYTPSQGTLWGAPGARNTGPVLHGDMLTTRERVELMSNRKYELAVILHIGKGGIA